VHAEIPPALAPAPAEETSPGRQRLQQESFGAGNIALKGRTSENNLVAVKQAQVNLERQE